MKVLYLDCSSGISGNMMLGALLEIVEDKTYLLEELKKLQLDGYKIKITKKMKNGIAATHVEVILEENNQHSHKENGMHHHHHTHRNLQDINKIIEESTIDEKSKQLAKRIFLRVAVAESKVHNKPISEVHFHEVGAIDSIIDIVGTAILINKIDPDKIIVSIVNDGCGFIQCAHGTMSVPVPATSEIFANSHVKFRQIEIDTELVTPTGAAIIAELAEDFISWPAMIVNKVGWGAGTKELTIPNVLKVYVGEIQQEKEEFVVMETNIDDCSGELLGYTSEKLLQNGALDAFYTPVYMKKNRPAYQLTVTCREKDREQLQNIIFKETTTIGIRYRYEQRTELERQMVSIETKYGNILAKKVKRNEEIYLYPEYESIKKIAEEKNIPLKTMYQLKEFTSIDNKQEE